jgi:DNA mismatch endonuclease (patch repair protein)
MPTSPQRSALMARVRQKNTAPELVVRTVLHSLGLRFRLHDRKLAGSPDIVLRRWRTVILVHGCFWHRHEGCSRSTTPKHNAAFWAGKFAGNVARDATNEKILISAGWRVVTIWECETKDSAALRDRIIEVFGLSGH